jgi:L-ascorbate metabolism protein UlaG (beta-lactamase superfamily)
MTTKARWFGQSAFLISAEKSVLVDPFGVPGESLAARGDPRRRGRDRARRGTRDARGAEGGAPRTSARVIPRQLLPFGAGTIRMYGLGSSQPSG